MSGAANDVSNSHEPSYYEIALTNRQVIIAFVILLVCLVAAFFSGVWLGRESGARAAVDQMVRNAPPPEEKKEGQNLEEFEFFDSNKNGKGDNRAEAKPAEPSPAPPAASTAPPPSPAASSADSTLAEDFGAEDTEAAPRTPPPAPAAPAAAQPKKPAQSGVKPAGTDRPAQAKTAPETPAGTARPKPGGSPEPVRAAGQVVIQVFSSSEKDQAERIRDRLVSGGQKAYLSPVEVAGRTMYRVRIGPFDSRDKAQKVAEQVRKGYKLDTWVTE